MALQQVAERAGGGGGKWQLDASTSHVCVAKTQPRTWDRVGARHCGLSAATMTHVQWWNANAEHGEPLCSCSSPARGKDQEGCGVSLKGIRAPAAPAGVFTGPGSTTSQLARQCKQPTGWAGGGCNSRLTCQLPALMVAPAPCHASAGPLNSLARSSSTQQLG